LSWSTKGFGFEVMMMRRRRRRRRRMEEDGGCNQKGGEGR
jgi:hypothetical protein